MPRTRALVCCAVALCVALVVAFVLQPSAVDPSTVAPPPASRVVDPVEVASRAFGHDLSAPMPSPAVEPPSSPDMPRTNAGAETAPLAVRLVVQTTRDNTIRVVRDGASAAGLIVQLYALAHPHQTLSELVARTRGMAPTFIATTDAEGLVRVTGDWPNGALLWCQLGQGFACELLRAPRGAGEWHRLELGSATVRGIVYDPEGRPRAGTLVQAIGETQTGPGTWRSRETLFAVTDASGAFEIPGLPRELVDVSCSIDGAARSEQRRVDTTSAQVPRVCFGNPPGACVLRGRILDQDGEPLPGYAMVRCRDAATGEQRVVHSDSGGSFQTKLPVGVWFAAVEGGNQDASPESIEECIDIVASDVTRDLRSAGKNVVCTLRFADPRTPAWTAELGLELTNGSVRTWNRPPVRTGDSYTMVWRGLAAGSYRLRCREGQRIEIVGAPADGFEVDLNGPAATRRIEVVLR
jgi:hypothetical protein